MKILALTKKKISTRIFKGLVNRLQSIDSSLETLSLKASFSNYTVSFYACENHDYNLLVEDYGYTHKGEWYQLEPTDSQFKQMEELLNREWKRLNDIQKVENTVEFWDVAAEQSLISTVY